MARKRLKMTTARETRKAVNRIANMLLNGEIDAKTANAILYAANVTLGAIHTDEQQAKIDELEQALGDSFLKVSRGCLVSVMAIHDVTKVIELTNGESLSYSTRNRNEVAAQLQAKQKLIISRFSEGTIPSEEAYQAHRLCRHRNGMQRRAPGGEVISQELLTDC